MSKLGTKETTLNLADQARLLVKTGRYKYITDKENKIKKAEEKLKNLHPKIGRQLLHYARKGHIKISFGVLLHDIDIFVCQGSPQWSYRAALSSWLIEEGFKMDDIYIYWGNTFEYNV